MSADVRAFFLDSGRGPRYALHHRPRTQVTEAARGALLYVHPLAEEMNKARRMAAVAARAFAAQGFDVLQIDLLGCGDSPGDFSDATWADWVADVRDGLAWLRAETGRRADLWGLRAGCLLCLDAAREEARAAQPPKEFLFWQPPADGKAVAQQFLRLRIAALALRQGPPAEGDTAAPAAQPAAGADDAIEVAGYRVHPQLLAGLQRSAMQAPAFATRSAWLEATSRQPPELLPATFRNVAQWREGGHSVHAHAVEGPGFWLTQEITVAPALVQASIAWLLERETAPAGAR